MKNIIMILGIALSLISCINTKVDGERKPIKRNYIVLLDLSDRLIKEQDQEKYDKEIINNFIENYIKSIKDTIVKYNKNINLVRDKFQVFVAHQDNLPYDKLSYENKLQFDMSNKSGTDKKAVFNNFHSQSKATLDELYRKALFSNNSDDYKGADIWKFFNEDLSAIIDKDKNTENILLILTDGYLYFENDNNRIRTDHRFNSCDFMKGLRNKGWEQLFDTYDYGLVAPNIKFNNLKVIVSQMTPLNNWNEYELLKKIWTKWLYEMNVKEVLITKKDNLNKTKREIQEFIY